MAILGIIGIPPTIPNPNLPPTWGFICPRSFTVTKSLLGLLPLTRWSVLHHHFLARRVFMALRLDGQGPAPPVLQAGMSPQHHGIILRTTPLVKTSNAGAQT